MSLAVGGEAEAIGRIEIDFLIQTGLRPDDYLIDVGCGSGRLARAAKDYLRGSYLGLDVVPELLEYARRTVDRPTWRFELVSKPAIPQASEVADMIVFFSVFTHLAPRNVFRYLRDARRVLRPGGLVVFSFLEYDIPGHFSIFENFVKQADDGAEEGGIRIDFLGREAIRAWAARLGFEIVLLARGDERLVQLRAPVRLSGGAVVESPAVFGQSLCVMRA